MTITEIIAKKVINFRKENQLSTRAFAALSGISLGALSNIENLNTYPNMDTVMKLAKAMNIEPYEIFLEEDQYDI